MTAPAVALLSLEPWDDVWRRNQHLAHELVTAGLVSRLTFVEPSHPGRGRRFSPEPGIDVVRAPMLVPNRLGGIRASAWWLRHRTVKGADVLWVNDAPVGAACLGGSARVLYDVTDDWRTHRQPPRIIRRIEGAEDALTAQAVVVVCSEELRSRWRDRYSVDPAVVHNGIDPAAFAAARPVPLGTYGSDGPHAGYVGTLHGERLDLDAVLDLARGGVTVHLVGPDSLQPHERTRLDAQPRVVRHGPVPAADVPGWLVSFDVLICPHLITEFTLSLDAIKSYEYRAAGRPIVATATSGFQHLADVDGVTVVDTAGFTAAVRDTAGGPRPEPDRDAGWAGRATEFAHHLRRA